jgi:hypothetical protein
LASTCKAISTTAPLSLVPNASSDFKQSKLTSFCLDIGQLDSSFQTEVGPGDAFFLDIGQLDSSFQTEVGPGDAFFLDIGQLDSSFQMEVGTGDAFFLDIGQLDSSFQTEVGPGDAFFCFTFITGFMQIRLVATNDLCSGFDMVETNNRL